MSALLNDLMTLQHFHFMRPLWLLILIPAFILGNITSRDDAVSVWKNIMSKEVLSNLTIVGNSNHVISPKNVLWVLIVLMSIILAGPTWKQQASPFNEDSSVLVIALDVSETMKQSDIQPSRLLRAKQKIIELLELRGDSKTALIAYAGSAHTVMPITTDSEMIRHFLDALEPGIMPVSGKRPQTVIPFVNLLVSNIQTPSTILLIGDGSSEETAIKFSEYFDNNNDQLIVWAIGDPTRVNQDDNTSTIIPMQLEQLKNLASESNARFVLMTHDKQDISKIDHYIENNLVVVDDESRPWHDAGYPLVFLVAILTLMWFRRGWTLQW